MATSLPALSPITLGTLTSAVLSRLGDPTGVYWSTAEIEATIVEALRVWNAMTRFWRTTVQFSTVAGTAFYDLSTTLAAQLGYTVTDAQLVTAMEYHLLEAPTPAFWTGTAMFTLAQLTGAVQRRRDQFLVETGAVLTYYAPPVTPSPNGRIQLQDSIIDIRRLAWVQQNGYYSPVWRTDEWNLFSLMGAWTATSGIPTAYSVSVTPPFALQFAPPPSNVGTLDLMVVNAGAELNPAGPVAMGVPDDFAWVVMWGALADLLGENGPAYDPARSQYCQQRWGNGLDLARNAATVMQGYVNNLPMATATLFDMDTLNPTWQNAQGQPTTVAMAGLNMLALSPVPDGIYSVTVDIVQNAPVPAAAATQILIGRDVADALVDYAQHVAAFKQIGEEFFATGPLLERMLNLGMVYRQRVGAQTSNKTSMFNRGTLQLKQTPMKLETVR